MKVLIGGSGRELDTYLEKVGQEPEVLDKIYCAPWKRSRNCESTQSVSILQRWEFDKLVAFREEKEI